MIDLAALVSKELASYDAEVDAIMQDEIDVLSTEIVKDLKSDPIIPVRTGKYKRSFYVKRIIQRKGVNRCVIANREYRLTHLLEDGHAVKRDGKIVGETRAFSHWDKAQKKADTLLERIERRLQG